MAGDAISAVADAITTAVGQIVATVATLWINVPSLPLTSDSCFTPGQTSEQQSASCAPSDTVAFLQSHLLFYTGALAVGALLVGGAKLALEQRGDGLREIARLLFLLVLVSTCGVAFISGATLAADAYSTWIIGQATGGDFGANMTALLGLSDLATGGVADFLIIILGLVALLASLIQIVLMVVRAGMLVILAGVLPTAAAASNFQFGRHWLQKLTAWTVAFILYKPAAATVYATAFKLSGESAFKGGGLMSIITGLTLMLLALFALPALMRFVMPMVGAMAAGSAGGVLAGGAVLAATLPTGAIRVPASATAIMTRGGGGGGDGSSSAGPSGAVGGGSGGGSGPLGGSGRDGSNGSDGSSGGGAGGGGGKGRAVGGLPSRGVLITGAAGALHAARSVRDGAQRAAAGPDDSTNQNGGSNGSGG
ncbi:MAG: hypothetical protein ACLP50_08340 [Solirubrobacteraceae bacterium]